ncbi:MAG: CDP-diacylglycerol--serine O-phosphatidyltransferase [Lysobacteraceae bacterium]|nr:MAG: CDP-diacylglycerol--serine O-phosphatidyltransferase [Xanthomonadaceae bacterium]
MASTENTDDNGTRRRRGIYLLPNLLTTGALFSGFYSIVASMDGRFEAAAIAIFVAALLDGLDGRVARLTNTQSEFGVQYDSLSDLIAFGLAPALVMYSYSLSSLKAESAVLGKAGWLVAFLYAACAALRLARFNTQAGVADKRYFQGLASPAAAGLMMSTVWTFSEFGITGLSAASFALPVTLLSALLMVSNVRYFSFKGWPGKDHVPFLWIFLFVVLLVLLTIDPPKVLLAATACYALSGPILTVWSRQRHRSRRNERQRDAQNSDG